MKATREEMKAEAIKRMKKLGIYAETIKQFEKENLISIIKDTQPMSEDILHELKITGIGLDDEGEFCELKPRSYKMEFIGDSITSGEGLAGKPDEMEWITQWFCASKTYAVQLAKKMNGKLLGQVQTINLSVVVVVEL